MPKQLANPFYVLLMIAGVVFGITACCYVVMMVQQGDPEQLALAGGEAGGLIGLMDRHGLTILMAELAILALFTFAAIGTDDYWTKKAEARAAETSDQRSAFSGQQSKS